MKLKFKSQELTLYDAKSDCRSDSNKKGYGCAKKNGTTYYFDLVPTSDPFATKLRYKKKSNSTTYAIADSNIRSLNGWAKSVYPSTYKTITSLSQENLNYLNFVRGTDMERMFGECQKLTTLNAPNWDTSRVTNMHYMFGFCHAVTTINAANWDTSKVTNMDTMFYTCRALTSLNISNWNTRNVTNMQETFQDCSALTSLDLSKWNTSKVTNMAMTFMNCYSLTSLNVSTWDTRNVTDMLEIFYKCSSLTSINIANWNTNNVTSMSYLVADCSALTSLDLSKWNTSKVIKMRYMFSNCTSLTTLDLSNFDTSNVTDMFWMFNNCNSLAYIVLNSTTVKFILKASNQLSKKCKILVPSSAINTYKTHSSWSSKASQLDEIENYKITRSSGKVTVTPRITYTLSGRKLTITTNDTTLTICRVFFMYGTNSMHSVGSLSFSNKKITYTISSSSVPSGSATLVLVASTNSTDVTCSVTTTKVTVNTSDKSKYARIDDEITIS